MRPLAILIAGEPVPAALAARGSFAAMIRGAVGDAWQGEWAELDGRAELPDFERFAGLIVTGSSANVPTREPWILAIENYLARAVTARARVFGICFGHQLLGQALGGEVAKNPNGREIGTVEVEILGSDPLLTAARGAFTANMTHVDSVVKLPAGARLLAQSPRDENAMVRFSETAWGVQFHPEIDAEIIGHYVAARRAAMIEEGLDADAIAAELRDTPAAIEILRRFAESARSKC
ncbi:MAG TPA: glutamine amidotransferase [Polyangiaceae bacterium]